MKKWVVIGGVTIAALILSALILAPSVSAQRQSPFTPRQFDGLTLEGPGSSIGVTVRDLSADDASKAKIQQSDGVLVEDVREGTPASRAGIKNGDIVLEFDGERPRSARQFTRLVRETPPGRSVKLTIVRDGSRRTLDITPEAGPGVGSRAFTDPNDLLRTIPRDFNYDGNHFNLFEGTFGTTRLGVVVTPLSDQLAAYFGVKEGVLVSEVTANTPAATAGLKAGDVITAVNGRPVMGPQDVVSQVREVQAGGAIDLRVTRDRKELTLKATIPERRRPTFGGGQAI